MEKPYVDTSDTESPLALKNKGMEENYGYTGEDLELMRMAKNATIPRGTKIEEIMLWATNAGIAKIGLAPCASLLREAERIAEILSPAFETKIVTCKVGKIPLRDILQEDVPGIACNPIGQVKELEEWGSQLNIVIGLCLGHDMLFNKYSSVPTTTLIVKDRANRHNPMATLFPASTEE